MNIPEDVMKWIESLPCPADLEIFARWLPGKDERQFSVVDRNGKTVSNWDTEVPYYVRTRRG